MTERTDLEWGYEPADAFEAPTDFGLSDGTLRVENGRAVLTLDQPADPVTPDIRARSGDQVSAVFRARQIVSRRPIKLGGPAIVQHDESGGRRIVVSVGEILGVASVGRADAIVTDSGGRVMKDTRAERIAREHSVVALLSMNAPKSATLRRMLESFAAAIEDSGNELVSPSGMVETPRL